MPHLSSPPQGLILDAAWREHETSKSGIGVEDIIHVPETSLDGQLCPLSISHDGDFAVAVAVVPLLGTNEGGPARLDSN